MQVLVTNVRKPRSCQHKRCRCVPTGSKPTALPNGTGNGEQRMGTAYYETETAELSSWSKQGKVLKNCSREEKDQL